MKKAFKNGFTLAEIMIVLTIIGVLTMILLPIANHSRPDENVMKFKKADTTLKNAIHELVTNDKFFVNGDLGDKADGHNTYEFVINNSDKYGDTYYTEAEVCNNTTHEDINSSDMCYTMQYFCYALNDVLSTKEVNCSTVWNRRNWGYEIIGGGAWGNYDGARTLTKQDWEDSKKRIDLRCKEYAKSVGKEIVTTDNIVYYESSPASAFNSTALNGKRQYSPPNQFPAYYRDQNGFDIMYKILCIDVDGWDETKGSKNCDDVKDICPFGYGVRADGKILSGARADEWLEKGFQKGSNEN